MDISLFIRRIGSWACADIWPRLALKKGYIALFFVIGIRHILTGYRRASRRSLKGHRMGSQSIASQNQSYFKIIPGKYKLKLNQVTVLPFWCCSRWRSRMNLSERHAGNRYTPAGRMGEQARAAPRVGSSSHPLGVSYIGRTKTWRSQLGLLAAIATSLYDQCTTGRANTHARLRGLGWYCTHSAWRDDFV